jgi:TRAP transporter TAXI family solute receptor
MFGRRLFDAIKLDVNKQDLLLGDATTALQNRHIDALLWMGGVPTRALAELHSQVGIRLLPTENQLQRLRYWYGPVYRQAKIPSGNYGGGIPTIGVDNLLVCASTLANGIAAAVTRVLIKRPADLVPPEALGMQFLDNCSLIGTFDVPMHPGAVSAYQREHG